MEILGGLNPQQQEAVRHPSGPALVVAGPGSGKTRVLTQRVVWLVQEQGVDSQNILAITFTNKAAGEIKERVRRSLGAGLSGLWVGTFHSICARILRIDGEAIGIPSHFVIYDSGDTRALLKKVLEELNVNVKEFPPAKVAATISNAKTELLTAKDYPQHAYGYYQETVAKVYPLYQRRLRESNALDFDDLLNETVRLLEESPKVRSKYQGRFQHILVDEYQDTNQAQYLLTKAIGQKHRNIFCVGDVSQSIYSWRGADYRNILRFEQDYPQAKVYQLGQNYRSTPQIVEAARGVIEHNRTHIPIELWTAQPEGEKLVLYEAESELKEASYITSRLASGRWGRYAILYRTNAQSRVLEDVLMRAGIPYRLVGGVRFYERQEVADVLAYLKVFYNPADEVSWERVLKIPFGGGRHSLARKRQLLHDLFERLRVGQVNDPLAVLDEVLAASRYLKWLKSRGEEHEFRVENVKELRSVAAGFERLGEFLENVALVQNEHLSNGLAPLEADTPNGVTLMTLHAAKGLEFPEVFMVGMEEGLFPHSNSLFDQQELEEERRLCYVGMTRAMEKLHLIYTRQRFYFGRYQNNQPSRFLAEIPGHLMKAL